MRITLHRSDSGVTALISVISINSRIHTLNLTKAGVGSAGVFRKLESLCGDVAQHNVTSLLAECVGGGGGDCLCVKVTRECRYSSIAGSYVVPKVVSIAEPPKSKSTKPQEWKAVVGKLPGPEPAVGSVPAKTAKAAPASSTAAKNVKGGSNSTAAARKPLVSRN
jgi:hypothetical protein